MTKEEALLSEIARKLRKLDCVCEGINNIDGTVIQNYQPLDCAGDPIGSPIDVMATVSVAKQDVAICNYQQLADAINAPSTSNGVLTDSRVALTNTVVQAKATAGQLYGYSFYNPDAVVAYIQIFNATAASVTLGTTTPTYVIAIPATSSRDIEISNGIEHTTAISYAATTTATGSTALGAALTGFILYK